VPELPEVEVAREELSSWLRGKTISAARILDRRLVGGQGRRRVESVLGGARVRGIERRGKYLVFDLGPRGRAVAHLGMTGEFILGEKGGGDRDPARRAVLELPGGRRIIYRDPRRLGMLRLVEGVEARRLALLGVEPLSAAFTPAALARLLQGRRLAIKLFLMDQRWIAGLGNIQAAEALYLAGIHPARAARDLSAGEIAALHRSIRRTLRETLRANRRPGAPDPFRVYGREGEPCRRCRAALRRIPQADRSTYFCPRCQRR
jgi:formamidopyrimidine-DNA glycosylase